MKVLTMILQVLSKSHIKNSLAENRVGGLAKNQR